MATLAGPTPQWRWPDRLRLPFSFDPARLAADLERLETGEWTRHFVRDNYEGDWSVLPLRAPVGETHPIRMIGAGPSDKGWLDTPLLQQCAYLAEVLAAFRCPINSARLMRLGPGSVIREHKDPDLAAEDGFARLHVPVTTSAEVEFLVAGTPVAMEAGSCWYLRLSELHSAHNRGTAPRVHLVFDAVMNDWLAALLDSAV
ncbi:MAG: hypothetical protein QOK17_83 [Sphingomonadales bacterium]|jgi:hypothetical protein|nr:hypothetical protein [Sphingomonadales bacterium]